MTTVVGFSFPVFHDNSTAVIVDGKLIFALEEERYTRHKHAFGEPPVNSLAEAFRFLLAFGIMPDDIDAFAVGFDPKLYPLAARLYHFRSSLIQALRIAGVPSGKGTTSTKELAKDTLVSIVNGFDYLRYSKALLRMASKQAGLTPPSKPKIIAVRHHLAHAASAYYFSGFNSSAIVTIDGVGETESTVVWNAKDGEFEELASIGVDKGSVGALYESVSEKLGLGRLEGPGKVMGLAPYGEVYPDDKMANRFRRILKQDSSRNENTPYSFDKEFQSSSSKNSKMIVEKYGRIADFLNGNADLTWNPKAEITPNVARFAWYMQDFTDEVLLQIAKWARKETGTTKIGLAGGVALNAKANMELHYSGIFNQMFIFPAASDAGIPAGAAAWVYEHVCGGKMTHGHLDNVYLGPGYSDEYVQDLVRKSKYRSTFLGENPEIVARLVSEGKIVVWFQGRSELGPRALGNRSIVADPTKKETWKIVNDIKGREYWRPLAPSILSEDKGDYFINPIDHEFMILMHRLKEEAKERVPAVCHIDNTARPQTIRRETNRTWYDIIKCFKEITGEGLVVNTSFNLAGEPLVQTPQDAIRSFSIGGFDAIYLQGWLIEKNH